MSSKQIREDLANHVVKSTLQVVMIDKSLAPKSGGGGCIIQYKGRKFFITVQHVADKENLQAAIDTGFNTGVETRLYSLPALTFLDHLDIKKERLEGLEAATLRSLDICYAEILDVPELLQEQQVFGDLRVSGGPKRIHETDLDYIPTNEEGYSFYGRIGGELKDKTLHQTGKLFFGIKYDRKIGSYERFILDAPITDEAEFSGLSGAPVFSETGELVAFVAHGFLNQKYVYAFSARDLKWYLDISIGNFNTDFHFESHPKGIDGATGSTGDDDIGMPPILLERNFDLHKGTPPEKFTRYKVLYGTNRESGTQVGKLTYTNSRDKSLHLGSAEISIPDRRKVGSLPRPGWFRKLLFLGESPEKHFTVLSNTATDPAGFMDILKGLFEKAGEKDILLFIHGFNVEFNESVMRAAQLGFDLNFKGAVAAFSWPAYESVTGYVADTDSARIAAPYLAKFIKQLLANGNVQKLHILAHSMGNVVLTEALIKLKNEGFYPGTVINQIILAAPDIDREYFLNDIMPAINRNTGLTLYASDKDKALIASKKIHKGYVRIGEAGDNIVITDGMDSVDASSVDTSLLGHGYFADTQALINDIHMVLLGLRPEKRILDPKNKLIDGVNKGYWAFRIS